MQHKRCFTIFRTIPTEVFLKRSCPKNMQQIYRRTLMRKCHFNKVALQLCCNFIEIALLYGYSPVNLLHIFRITFLKDTSGRLFLYFTLEFFELSILKWISLIEQCSFVKWVFSNVGGKFKLSEQPQALMQFPKVQHLSNHLTIIFHTFSLVATWHLF